MEKKFRCLGKRMKRLSSHGDGALILTYVHLFYFVKGGSGVVGDHIFFNLCHHPAEGEDISDESSSEVHRALMKEVDVDGLLSGALTNESKELYTRGEVKVFELLIISNFLF